MLAFLFKTCILFAFISKTLSSDLISRIVPGNPENFQGPVLKLISVVK